jgi:hypothetical protein
MSFVVVLTSFQRPPLGCAAQKLGFGRSAARTSDTVPGLSVRTSDAGLFDRMSPSSYATRLVFGRSDAFADIIDAQCLSGGGGSLITSGSRAATPQYRIEFRCRCRDVASAPISALPEAVALCIAFRRQ